MGDINVLAKQVSELIAAGEVIERPSSVIKELIENSIDAGASSIIVEIKNGGVKLMRVTDNGKGIKREDVKNAFLRHATSKILKQDDLDSISTLGFRGEALASICAVSRVEVMTKNTEEDDGTRYEISGGEEISFDIAGCPQGTTFIVRDLFYNVPARMKFLKKDVSEGNSIAALVDRMALSHPEISFTLIREGKQTLKTAGDNKLKNAILQVFGREFASSLIPVSYEHSGIRLSGYVSIPTASRANRTMQTFFINGRYVKTKTAAAALEQAYKGSIMTGKFPSCVINMNMNCSSLDVNVHPAKLEVRFTNERDIYECVYQAVKSAVLDYDTRNGNHGGDFSPTDPKILGGPADKGIQLGFVYNEAELPFGNMSINDDPAPGGASGTGFRTTQMTPYDPRAFRNGKGGADSEQYSRYSLMPLEVRNGTSGLAIGTFKMFKHNDDKETDGHKKSSRDENTAVTDEANNHRISERASAEEAGAENLTSNTESCRRKSAEPEISVTDVDKRDTRLKYIGEVFSSYIIIEYGDDRLMFIDKHAAHERLIYERLKKQHTESRAQLLLEPVTVTLDAAEYEAVLENKEVLYEAGFDVDSFGSNTVIIRSVPISAENADDIEEEFSEIADYLQKHKKLIPSEKTEWLYQNTACRSAVKAGNINHPEELISLVEELERNPEIRYCPHGRPIYFFMSRHELEKSFKRTL